MKTKIFFLVLALLTLYVVIHLIIIRTGNIDKVDKQIVRIDKKLLENRAEKTELMKKKKEMEATLASIPATIIEGFEDPERQFVDFMDYIDSSQLKNMEGSIVISQMQTFKEHPVPLQESQFEITFNIKSARQLEEFLDYLLIKSKYPLNVQRFEISRIPQQYPRVFLKVALLLPATIDLPQFTQAAKEAS